LIKDVEEKEQIEKFLKQLENPFGFLDTIKEDMYDDNEEDEGQPKTKLEEMVL
jgi:hypothetical protein